jgi:hypothetical protein
MGPLDPMQLTAQVRESLKACLMHSAAISATASTANRLQGEAAQDRPLGELGEQLDQVNAVLGQQSQDEIRCVDFSTFAAGAPHQIRRRGRSVLTESF